MPTVAVALLLSGFSADPAGPGSGPWQVDPADAHGLNASLLEAMGEAIFKKVPVRECVVVIKDGSLVFEKYGSRRYNNSAHQGYSQTKTLGALLAGWAQSRGLLDIDADITKGYGVPSPKKYGVTSRQIMSQALAGSDGPGEDWEYDAVGTKWINHLPRVFANATNGRLPSDVFEKEFRRPLGLSPAFSWKDANKAWDAGSEGTCRDYARFGQLMLNRGQWKGVDLAQPIVSADYVRNMTTPQTRFAPYPNYSNPCYGLLTWLNTNPGSDRGSAEYPGVCKDWPKATWFPKGSGSNVYLLAGLLGQETMVIPDHAMVVVSMGTTTDDYPLERAMYEGVCTLFPGECIMTKQDPAEAGGRT